MITPENLLRFAQSMPRKNETDFRVCISRAYYAAFHKAKCRAFQDSNYTYKSGSGTSHKDLSDYYTEQNDEKSLLVADLLKKLKRYRVRADYRINESIDSGLVNICLKQAEEIFSIL